MKNTAQLLDFDKIKEQLQALTLTAPGTARAVSLAPEHRPGEVRALQEETSEAVGLLLQDRLRFGGCRDVYPHLQRAGRGGLLQPLELKEVSDFLRAAGTARRSFMQDEGAGEKFPRLFGALSALETFPQVASELERCISPQGAVKDEASPALASLRSRERKLQEEIRSTMDAYVRNPQLQKYLQDPIVTLRGDRYVLPVKQEFRAQVPGAVHDQSSSGMTLFIEPLPALELNNRLQEIRKQIEKETERILYALTGLVGSNSSGMAEAYGLYGRLDFILARARLSLNTGGLEPELNEDGIVELRAARHPLLERGKAVPIDIQLGRNFDVLVITGPNTGGKTVTLKSVGLLALMAQSGLHVPAGPGTNLGVFSAIYADIGDEQNIEQSLSTFSGHMAHIIEILQRADASSLVLLDELGAGTDPSEGAALAMAVLDELHSRGTRTLATTHINELKVFAHLREGMENASMEFDPEALAPTFRLMIGVPGQSNALTVAERLGMPRELIGRARSFIRKDLLDLEEVVSGLVEERQKLSRGTTEVERRKEELEHRLQQLEREQEELQEKKKDIYRQAKEEAGDIVSSARKEAGQILKRLYQAEREQGRRGREVFVTGETARKKLKELEEETRPEAEEEPRVQGRPLGEEEATAGREVFVKSLRCRGEILRFLSPDEITVRAGALKVTTSLDDLETSSREHVGRRAAPTPSRSGSLGLMKEKSGSVPLRLDLRGLNLEEALAKVEKHIDDSILAGRDHIEIIHGKGTGKLRRGLHEYLEKKGDLLRYRLGGEGEGGSGVTIVDFKGGRGAGE